MKTIGVFINPYKKQLKESLPEILKVIKKAGLEILCPENSLTSRDLRFQECQILTAGKIPPLCDMIFCFGGDGTVLRTVQVVRDHQTPILAEYRASYVSFVLHRWIVRRAVRGIPQLSVVVITPGQDQTLILVEDRTSDISFMFHWRTMRGAVLSIPQSRAVVITPG